MSATTDSPLSAQGAESPAAKTSLAIRLAMGVFVLLSLALIWARAMSHGMSHDEHQFVAPAVLLAKEGLLPYRDFPMFHLPNLVLIYSLFARFTDYYLLAATGFGAICAWIMVCLLFVRVSRWQESYRPFARVLIAAAFAVLLMTSQNFVWTTGRTWNHDFPVLMTVLAFLLHLRAASATKAWPWLFLSGACVGLAIGGRLTYLPLIAPFGLAIFFIGGLSFRQKIVLGAVFGGGVLIALLPSFYFLWKAPEAFYFDNFKYPRLRLLDPTDVAQETFTVKKKARFLWKYVVLPNWPVFAAFFVFGLAALASRFRQFRKPNFEVLLLVLLLPFLVQGGVSPTRTHTQHFYSLMPFAVLAAAYGFSRLQPATRLAKGAAIILGVLVISSVAMDSKNYKKLRQATTISHWTPIQVHLAGVQLRERVGGGKVLTYSPVEVLEGGMRIYPEIATGPFAVRTAYLVADPQLRKRLHFVATDDFPAFLTNDPPDAVVLGTETPEAERPFKDFVIAREYLMIEAGSERRGGKRYGLFVKPR